MIPFHLWWPADVSQNGQMDFVNLTSLFILILTEYMHHMYKISALICHKMCTLRRWSKHSMKAMNCKWMFNYDVWFTFLDSNNILLTHWGRVTHIWFSKLTIIGSDNGLSPDWRQTIIWTNAGILIFWPLGTKFSEVLIRIEIFSFKKMQLKLPSLKWQPFCLGLNELSFMPNWGWSQDHCLLG